MDNLNFFDVDNDFGMNNNKSFMSIDMNYNKSFMSVDMNNKKISGDFYNDERMDNNNESELDNHEEHEENTRFAYPLVKSQVFESWKAVDYENDKSDETPRRHVYMCTKRQRYVPHKEAHILGERDWDHKTIGCSFHINLYWWKNDNQIYISSIVSTHNHEMIQNITIVKLRYRRLIKEMQDDVRLLTSCSVRASSIIEVLQQKNPEKYIHTYNVYNMIQTIYYESRVAGDAGSTYLELIKKQYNDSGYFVEAKFEGTNNYLITNKVSTEMFTDDMFDAFVIELEELISDLDYEHFHEIWKSAILAIYNNNFGLFEHHIHVNSEHIEKIRKGFGIMKKVLDLSIAMGRYEELYEMHLNLMKEMEIKLKTDNNHNNFITMINNPVSIHFKGYNAHTCNLDSSINQMNSTQENHVENSSLSSMADKDLNHENMLCHYEIYGQSGNNARICNSDNLISIVDKNSIVNRLHHCGACGQAGHNT
ncbi:8611_t:CDS:2, partial [Cetraspora pellucida]